MAQLIFLLSETSTTALYPAHPPIHWVSGSLSPWVKQAGFKLTNDFHLVLQFKKSWSYTSNLPLRVQGRIYLTRYYQFMRNTTNRWCQGLQRRRDILHSLLNTEWIGEWGGLGHKASRRHGLAHSTNWFSALWSRGPYSRQQREMGGRRLSQRPASHWPPEHRTTSRVPHLPSLNHPHEVTNLEVPQHAAFSIPPIRLLSYTQIYPSTPCSETQSLSTSRVRPLGLFQLQGKISVHLGSCMFLLQQYTWQSTAFTGALAIPHM